MTEQVELSAGPCRASGTSLRISSVTKRFGARLACDDVSLSVGYGEILGLLGQNGAGKSTLAGVVAGVVVPDAGSVRIGDLDLDLGDPKAAALAGVAVVHQHFSLVRSLTVWENVALADSGRVKATEVRDQIAEIGNRYGLQIDPRATVGHLSPGERQRIEIVKCLRKNPRVLILDEPTSVLTQTESRKLFEVLGQLVHEEDRSVVLISHRLEEVMRATDRVTVMRDGQIVHTAQTSGSSVDELARTMLGREISLRHGLIATGLSLSAEADIAQSHSPPPAEVETTHAQLPSLEIHDAVVVDHDRRRLLDGLSLRAWPGEIVAVAGVEGNGQAALVDLLSGLVKLAEGSVLISGEPVDLARCPSDILGVVPGDRHDSGSIQEMSVAENLALGDMAALGRRGLVDRRRMVSRAREVVRDYGIAAPSVNAPLWALSGGNQQRVILACHLSQQPKVLVAAQPTQGLDVGAMEEVWTRIESLARDHGSAVVLVSTDLDEIMAIADRIVVIQKGAISGEMLRGEIDPDRLALLIGGQRK